MGCYTVVLLVVYRCGNIFRLNVARYGGRGSEGEGEGGCAAKEQEQLARTLPHCSFPFAAHPPALSPRSHAHPASPHSCGISYHIITRPARQQHSVPFLKSGEYYSFYFVILRVPPCVEFPSPTIASVHRRMALSRGYSTVPRSRRTDASSPRSYSIFGARVEFERVPTSPLQLLIVYCFNSAPVACMN